MAFTNIIIILRTDSNDVFNTIFGRQSASLSSSNNQPPSLNQLEETKQSNKSFKQVFQRVFPQPLLPTFKKKKTSNQIEEPNTYLHTKEAYHNQMGFQITTQQQRGLLDEF